MTIFVLITGTLHKDAVPRTSQSGKEFTTANVRIEADGQTTWANVIAFDQAAQDELKRLQAGDTVSVQGKAKLGVFEGKDGQHRASLDVVAGSVTGLSPKAKPNPRRSAPGRRAAPANVGGDPVRDMRRVYVAADDLNDELSF